MYCTLRGTSTVQVLVPSLRKEVLVPAQKSSCAPQVRLSAGTSKHRTSPCGNHGLVLDFADDVQQPTAFRRMEFFLNHTKSQKSCKLTECNVSGETFPCAGLCHFDNCRPCGQNVTKWTASRLALKPRSPVSVSVLPLVPSRPSP